MPGAMQHASECSPLPITMRQAMPFRRYSTTNRALLLTVEPVLLSRTNTRIRLHRVAWHSRRHPATFWSHAMQTVNPTATRYDSVTILSHWFMALLIGVQWIVALSIDLFPKGPLRIDARSVHIVCGL